jgi:hypothetical protein
MANCDNEAPGMDVMGTQQPMSYQEFHHIHHPTKHRDLIATIDANNNIKASHRP